ncbi:phenylalanine--tRNA ligase subunit beta [Reinekea blandensis]|uniref:Phenylalanine--tRNA ligase beta subunit n=1 Tax=Reinekea blandensis MED297 TaxID=314283 RepID=A4BHB2_9GAMM|nr:phenylalanine--tRNA ligase subunit beta [Reinekea blandensis]EAR08460.1 phenylalanyl-tRNA synthetase beta subunit [Reinekea sp. MED297] [Reinekea blandensis MED297]
MKFSEKWLRQWVNPSITSQELMDQVTMAGLEVDGSEKAAEDFSGVVVGEILSCAQHPNADKLQVCQVTNGTDTVQVICGAPNARQGLKVAFAEVGAVLPGDFKIKKAKLRQEESFGMLCSEKELGLSEAHDGIMELATDAVVGADLREYLELDDLIIDVDLTPNRADCLSLRGLAREVGVLNKASVTEPTIAPVAAVHQETFPVNLIDTKGCPRYVGRVLNDVDVSVSTPVWMAERLRRSGIRSIDPVVDVTNYVMLELGQPMHGFDLDELAERIDVRRAEKGEKITLLDGQEIELTEQILVIADAKGPLAMAGIMGGENSGVSTKTTRVFLESAFFAPIQIAGKARGYGLHTDSSHRFERGVDSQLQEMAVERATQLLVDICGAKPGPLIVEENKDTVPVPAEIELYAEVVSSSLGMELSDQTIRQILTGLEFSILAEQDGYWKVRAPSWRFDMAIQADLIEEIARIYGYNNLPVTAPMAAMKPQGPKEQATDVNLLVDRMVSLGYQEAITYSFVEPAAQKAMFPKKDGIELANPISADMSVMRVSLWPGLLKALQHNLNRQQDNVRLFETGQRFRQEEKGLAQIDMLAGVVTGSRLAQGWYESGETVDFYDVKGDLEQLLALIKGVEFEFVTGKNSALHPGQCARIERNGKLVGYIGALHPNLAKQYGFKKDVFLFELRLDRTLPAELPSFEPLSRHPASTRDLAVVVDEDVSVSSVMDTVREMAGEDLISLNLFDIYRGKGIDSKRKSLAMGLTWQNPSRTLTDDEINRFMESIIKTLQTRLDAVLRG